MSKYRKFIVAALAAGLTAAQTALPLTPVQHAWVGIVLAALGALGVLSVANKPDDSGVRPLAGPPRGY